MDLAVNPSLGLGIPEDALAEPPIEGEPKTAELPVEFTDSNQLLEELDICKELMANQHQ